MYIDEIEIENYKCFKEKVSLKLYQGINVIVGKNNVGKTALLEAISLQFPDRPHFSIQTFPKRDLEPIKPSVVEATFALTGDEVKRLLISSSGRGDADFRLALDASFKLTPGKETEFAQAVQDAAGVRYAKKFFANKNFRFKLRREAISETEGNWRVPDDCYIYPKINRSESNGGNTQQYVDFNIERSDRSLEFKKTTQVSGGGRRYRDDFTVRIAYEICERAKKSGLYIYKFQAERIPLPSCPIGTNTRLEPDSSNLAEVLHLLLANSSLSNKFHKLVRQILTNVYQVAVIPSQENGNTVGRIGVWNSKRASEHNRLAFRLKDVGSGVSQILAILYVLLTAEEPQVIIIDEPQSFLHPDACRKLVEVLRVHGKNHQIIISTHSPSVITSAEPKSVTVVRQKGTKSVLKKLNIENIENQRIYLSEIGAKLSDVFGYDRIVWVEGITEEICFPKILERLRNKTLLGTAILGVYGVGEFRQKEKSDVRRIVDLYKRLTTSEGGLVPDALGFIFDRDDYPKEQIDEWTKDNPELFFTPRRNYESYLLEAEAIAFTINKLERQPAVTVSEVEAWLDCARLVPRYYKPLPVPGNSDDWRVTIHGKRLLEDLMKEFCTTQCNQNFKEKIHANILTEWILENSASSLSEVADLLETVMKTKLVKSES